MGDGELPPGEGGDPLGDLDEFARRAQDYVRCFQAASPFGEDLVG